MKNIAYLMLIFVFVVTIGSNTSIFAQQRQMSTAERRDIEEERRNQEAERRMSTAERRDLQEERRERTEQIRRELQERREQLERERQQRQQQERPMPTGERRDIEEERRNQEAERRMSTAERRDLQQERRERTEQIRRELAERYQQRQQQRLERTRVPSQPQPRGTSWTENNPYGQFVGPNTSRQTRAQTYHGKMLNEAEKSFYLQNPRIAYKVYEVEENATRQTDQRFPTMGKLNTPADAFRHAYATALLARDIGAPNAKYITDMHEMSSNNPPDQRAMDLHNNSVGLRIGSMVIRDRHGYRRPTDQELADITTRALQNGALVFLRDR